MLISSGVPVFTQWYRAHCNWNGLNKFQFIAQTDVLSELNWPQLINNQLLLWYFLICYWLLISDYSWSLLQTMISSALQLKRTEQFVEQTDVLSELNWPQLDWTQVVQTGSKSESRRADYKQKTQESLFQMSFPLWFVFVIVFLFYFVIVFAIVCRKTFPRAISFRPGYS